MGGGTFVTAPQMRVQGASSLVRSATARSVAWSVDVTASGRTVESSRSASGVPPAAVDRQTDRQTDGLWSTWAIHPGDSNRLPLT